MIFSILAFILSLVTTLFLIRYKHLHEQISNDLNSSGPQKFHYLAVPRIGGIGIFLSIFITSYISNYFLAIDKINLLFLLVTCSIPTFCGGLLEDLTKKVGVKTRFATTLASAIALGHTLNLWLTEVQIPGIDYFLSISLVSILLTLIAITGLTNAYNIIDGFNGLASMVSIINLLAIGFVAYKLNDQSLVLTCFIAVGAICGFFIWNYPRGLIFLGDGGAYLLGFLLAATSLLIVKRNPEVSPWFVLLVNIYPVFETLFTIWRRKFHQGKNPSLPDGAHIHSLIYRRFMRWENLHKAGGTATYARNAKTSLYLWLLSSLAVVPAIIWWDTSWVLQFFTFLFCISYVYLYRAIVKFRIPKILKKPR